MIIPAGLKVWLVAGATDMRKGFDGLAALIQMQYPKIHFQGRSLSFEVAAATGSNAFGTTARDCVYCTSVWKTGRSYGHRPGSGLLR